VSRAGSRGRTVISRLPTSRPTGVFMGVAQRPRGGQGGVGCRPSFWHSRASYEALLTLALVGADLAAAIRDISGSLSITDVLLAVSTNVSEMLGIPLQDTHQFPIRTATRLLGYSVDESQCLG
jgi:hypothetical protein